MSSREFNLHPLPLSHVKKIVNKTYRVTKGTLLRSCEALDSRPIESNGFNTRTRCYWREDFGDLLTCSYATFISILDNSQSRKQATLVDRFS